MFKSVEMPLVLSAVAYFVYYINRISLQQRRLSLILLTAASLIFFCALLSISTRKITNPVAANHLFATLFFLIFSSFFILTGQDDYTFYLIVFLQVFIGSFFQHFLIPVLITVFYVIYRYIKFGISDINITSEHLLLSLFLILSAWTVINRTRYSKLGEQFFPRAVKQRDGLTTLYDISRSIASGAPADEVLLEVTKRLGIFTNVSRSSILLIEKNFKKGRIAASFEGKHLRNREIDIEKYPEITEALKTGNVVTIADIHNSPLTGKIRGTVEPIKGQSVIVIPFKSGGDNTGVLFLRGFRDSKGFTNEEIHFCETVAAFSAQVLLSARLYEELHEVSEERQQMIKKLEEMYKQLEEANRMKSVFVANVSHELRTPLTSIVGYLELLTEAGFTGADCWQYLETIRSNADRLMILINELIDMTKIEAGIFDLFYEKSNLNHLVEFVCESLKPKLDESDIQLKLHLKQYDKEFYFDVNRIEQVMNNILSNAVKFSPSPSAITVSSSYDEDWATVSVKDQGKGIPKAEQERIFERFVQLDSTPSRMQTGAGIGLHLCKEIVQRHKGRIWVESGRKKGSTFYFSIPIVESLQQTEGIVNIDAVEARKESKAGNESEA